MNLYKGVRIFIVIFISITYLQASNPKQVKEILDVGSQMSNIRNMLETYALIATHVQFQDPKKRLKSSIKEYENLLNYLEQNFGNDKDIKKTLEASHKAWEPVKRSLLTALKNNDKKRMMDEGLFIHSNIRTVIKELESIKGILLKKYNIKNEELLNASIEIQASSQRLSAHYAMKMWGLPDKTIDDHWNRGVEIYTKSIKILKASPFYKDAKFKKLLDDTETQLNYFKTIIKFNKKFVPALVHKKAQRVYGDGQEITKMILKRESK